MAFQMNILNIVRAVIVFIALILCCVGTGVEWFKAGSFKYFLYGAKGSGDVIKYKDGGYCDAVVSRMDAAYAFAIISCLVIGFALITIALQFFLASFEKILKFASLGLSIAAVITTLISWAIGAGFYNGKFCGASRAAKDSGVDIAAGMALMIVAWILMIADAAIAIFKTFFGGSAAAIEANA